MSPNFTLHRPDPAIAVPVVIHVPHASTRIPDHCRGDFALAGADLQAVVDAMVDAQTDTIALQALRFGAHVFVNGVCRLVVDPERFPADADEPAARYGMGAVYERTHDGRRLRRPNWTAADRQARMDEFYHPHHRAMRELVEELQRRFTQPVHVLDLHSFPASPHPYETDRGVRPAFCLGYDDDHVPRRWVRWWDELAATWSGRGDGAAREQMVDHNRPFAGSFLPQGLCGDDSGVRSMMLEINRGLWAAPGTSSLPADMQPFGNEQRVREFLEFICADAR